MDIASLLAVVVLGVVMTLAWKFEEWISAKAKEAKERARKSKLENDKLEIEVNALKAKAAEGE